MRNDGPFRPDSVDKLGEATATLRTLRGSKSTEYFSKNAEWGVIAGSTPPSTRSVSLLIKSPKKTIYLEET